MHYMSHCIPHSPTFTHVHVYTHAHTHTHSLATPRFPLSLPVSLHPLLHTYHLSASDDVSSKTTTNKQNIRHSIQCLLEYQRAGRCKEKGLKRNFELWENCSVRCEQEGCSRQGDHEQRMTSNQSPYVSILHNRVFSFELVPRVWEGVYAERLGDSCCGRVPSKKQTKVAVLKIILSLTGSQWSALSCGLTCSCLLLQKETFSASFRLQPVSVSKELQ